MAGWWGAADSVLHQQLLEDNPSVGSVQHCMVWLQAKGCYVSCVYCCILLYAGLRQCMLCRCV